MALKDITTKIGDDATARVAEIQRDTAAQIAQIEEESTVQIAKEKRAQINALDKLLASRQKSALSRSRREARGVVDTARRQLIDTVFDNAGKELAQMDDAAYSQWIGALIDTVPTVELAQITQVITPVGREQITKETCAKKQCSAEIVTDSTIVAGLRLESDTLAYDLTAARLMDDARGELELVVADKLF